MRTSAVVQPGQSVTASAPGKLVLTGDYAVLLNAPALVMAVNRFAHSNLTITENTGWQVSSSTGMVSQAPNLIELLSLPAGNLLNQLVTSKDLVSRLPESAHLTQDTSTFYTGQNKLGVGSSASVLVATASLLERLCDTTWDDEDLIRIHNQTQGSEGSGLDVAAARHGGMIQFQGGETISLETNTDIEQRFLFTQVSARTGPLLERFRRVLRDTSSATLDVWITLAQRVASLYNDTPKFLESLHDLSQFVFEFDQHNSLGIYSAPHQTALSLANKHSILYKPSGAGGGDMGIAMSDDTNALDRFVRDAEQNNLVSISLEVASHGANCKL